MKLFAFASLIALAAAVPETVYTSRSVAAQVGNSACSDRGQSNINSLRSTEVGKPGEYAFFATVTQTIELRDSCDTRTSTVISDVSIGDAMLVGEEVVADKCGVISNTQDIKGFFTVEEGGFITFNLHTKGGPCAVVTVKWENIQVKRCSDRMAKIERQLERSLVNLSSATRGIQDATTDEEKAAQLKAFQEATVSVATLRQEMVFAVTCEA